MCLWFVELDFAYMFADDSLAEVEPGTKRLIPSMAQQFTTEMQMQQHNNMAAILKRDSMRDVTFLIGEEQKEFTGNRIAMSSISDPLRIMLFGSMKESQPDTEVIIDDIEPEGFQSVLNWAHLEDPQITVDNVVSVRSI